jgi:hypothetical protein
MDNVVNHPMIRHIERVELYCNGDKVDFYKKWDFIKVSEMTNFMRRINRNF